MKKVNFKDKFKKFSDQWSPKVIAELNDYQFKLVKIQNDFIWHKHIDTDEVFIVIEGEMFIEFKNEDPPSFLNIVLSIFLFFEKTNFVNSSIFSKSKLCLLFSYGIN